METVYIAFNVKKKTNWKKHCNIQFKMFLRKIRAVQGRVKKHAFVIFHSKTLRVITYIFTLIRVTSACVT